MSPRHSNPPLEERDLTAGQQNVLMLLRTNRESISQAFKQALVANGIAEAVGEDFDVWAFSLMPKTARAALPLEEYPDDIDGFGCAVCCQDGSYCYTWASDCAGCCGPT